MTANQLHRRSFLAGLASLVAAPAIVPYQNLMPVKVHNILETILSYRSGPYQYQWVAMPGGELYCPTGRRIIGLVRYSCLKPEDTPIDGVECEVVRHPKDGLFFKNIHEVRFTFVKDGVEHYASETNKIMMQFPERFGDMEWSYCTELPKNGIPIRI